MQIVSINPEGPISTHRGRLRVPRIGKNQFLGRFFKANELENRKVRVEKQSLCESCELSLKMCRYFFSYTVYNTDPRGGLGGCPPQIFSPAGENFFDLGYFPLYFPL